MFRREWISLFVALTCTAILATDVAQATPRRRRRQNNNYYYNNYYSGSTGIQRVASKVDDETINQRVLAVNYSYERASEPEVAFEDRLRVFLDLWEDELLDTNQALTAEVSITDLSNSANSEVLYFPVSFVSSEQQEYQPAVVDVRNMDPSDPLIRPAGVYRLFISLHRQADEYGDDTVIGRIPVPYYVATSGPSRLDRARHHIVMRTFREFYYTERGWQSGESYPMDCYAYYMWATGVCTVGAQNDWTILGNLFNAATPYSSGHEIPEISENEPIHGDYVRIPGHSFMLLAYDRELEQVWTMEANYGATIEVVRRSVGGGWTVGHLATEHIRPNLFTTRLVSTNDE